MKLEHIGDSNNTEPKWAYGDENVQAYGDWIADMAKWDWYGTFTFRNPTSELLANKNFTKISYGSAVKTFDLFMEKLTSLNGRPFYWVRVTEDSKWRSAPHFHALIGGAGYLKPYEVERIWYPMAGIAKVYDYDPFKGAAQYLSKTYGTMEFSTNLERHRLK